MQMSCGMIPLRKIGPTKLQIKDRSAARSEKCWSVRSVRRRDFLTATTLSLGVRSPGASCSEEVRKLWKESYFDLTTFSCSTLGAV